jgi:hypothetical protein
MQAEFQQAVDRGLECRSLFGIEMSAHPTREQVQVEYQKIWQNLGDRSVESLIDRPLMTDPAQPKILTFRSTRSVQSFFDPGNNPINGSKFADRTGLPRSLSR